MGRAAIEGVLSHPDLELAGTWVHSAAKDGGVRDDEPGPMILEALADPPGRAGEHPDHSRCCD